MKTRNNSWKDYVWFAFELAISPFYILSMEIDNYKRKRWYKKNQKEDHEGKKNN